MCDIKSRHTYIVQGRRQLGEVVLANQLAQLPGFRRRMAPVRPVVWTAGLLHEWSNRCDCMMVQGPCPPDQCSYVQLYQHHVHVTR